LNTPSILPATRVGGLGLFGLVLLALALLGCGQKAEVRKQTLYVFGTLVEISALTDDAAAFDAAIADLDALFQDMHGQWHAWQGEGELMRVNAALSRGEPVAVTAFTRPLLQASLEYSRAIATIRPARRSRRPPRWNGVLPATPRPRT
jgi:thiamine biosynthesis lipoprotein